MATKDIDKWVLSIGATAQVKHMSSTVMLIVMTIPEDQQIRQSHTDKVALSK